MADLTTAITAKEFSELDEKGKIAILAKEKQAELDAKELDVKKTEFYQARNDELASFDTTAQTRIGTFQSGISEERTVIELKWKDAEGLGAWVIPG